MHFAAFLDVGESVREPVKYYRNNVVGALSVLEAMAAESVSALRVLVDLRDLRRADRDADRRDASAAADQQLRRDEAGRRARAAALRARVRHPLGRAALLQRRRAPIPTARSARITRRRFTSSRARSRRRPAGRGLQVFGDDYPTPDGTCLRDYVHVTDLADAHVRALEAIAETGTSAAYNLGTGTPHSVREVIDAVERVTGRAVPWTLAPRRPGDPAVLYAAADKARAELGWTPRFSDLDAIVRTAWALAPDASARLFRVMTRQPAAPLIDPLLSVVMPAYNERDTIEEIIRRVLAVPLRHRAHRRRRLLDRRHARSAAGAAARAGVHAGAAAGQRRQGRGAADRVRGGQRRYRRHPGCRPRVLAGGVSGAHRADLHGPRGRRVRVAVSRPAPRVPVHALRWATGC